MLGPGDRPGKERFQWHDHCPLTDFRPPPSGLSLTDFLT